MKGDLIFLDTETTGLDPALHEVWEIAWAVNDGPIQSFVVPHDIATADPTALELNGYWARGIGTPAAKTIDVLLKVALDGATVVGSNPAFDTTFLWARWGVSPWHHRLLAVESFAMGILDYDLPQGLATVAADLRELGYEIGEPDHSAAGDVAVLRDVYNALREEAA